MHGRAINSAKEDQASGHRARLRKRLTTAKTAEVGNKAAAFDRAKPSYDRNKPARSSAEAVGASAEESAHERD